MSSTDGRREELALRFFRECLVPAAVRLRAREARLLPDGPDRAAATYYSARPPREEYVFDLSVPLTDVLRSQWKDYPELAALAAELSRLARDLRQHKEESCEVSPFIYAMF
jgi:hypothetical protein